MTARSDATELISRFTTVLLLIKGFNGNVDAFAEFLVNNCTPAQRAHDMPLLVHIKNRAESDPHLIHKLSYLIGEFDGLAPPPLRRSDGGAQQQEIAA